MARVSWVQRGLRNVNKSNTFVAPSKPSQELDQTLNYNRWTTANSTQSQTETEIPQHTIITIYTSN